MHYRWVYALISGIVIIPGIFSLLVWGLKPSIDFTGGTLLELGINPAYQEQINQDTITQKANQLGIEVASLQASGDNSYLLRAKAIDQKTNAALQSSIASESGVATVSAVMTEKRFETLGPTLGAETLRRALIAVALAALGIFLFVWYQFKDKKYGLSAVLAMLHDTLVIFGIFSLLGHFANVEVDTLFMTAVLTVLSFSVHDTIVVYHRIRESRKKLIGYSMETIIDKAINETMSRSINNSMTIIFMLLTLYLLGGETTKWFVFALLIGTISGTYSSPFVAAPLLLVWDKYIGKK